MPIVVGSNIASLRATRKLDRASTELATVSTRLSTGKRINSAADDAASLSIVESLNAESRVYTQAVRNINDASSMLNIAEGALSALTDVVSRQIELAQQAASGALTGKQRQALENEANALRSEYNRIVESTEFNGRKLLNGRETDLWVQQGFGTKEALKVSVGKEMGALAGDGTFSLLQVHVGSSNTYQVAAADFNGDGLVDLFGFLGGEGLNWDMTLQLSMTYNDKEWHLNKGGGVFTAMGTPSDEQITRVISLNERLTNSTAMDFNGDGFLDIILASGVGSSLRIAYGNVGGIDPTTTEILPGYSANTIQSADVNDDGYDDLILGRFDDGNISILLNDTRGNFSLASQITTDRPGTPAFGDFNGDGIIDLVVDEDSYSGEGQGIFKTFLGRGDGTFTAGTSVDHGFYKSQLTVADFNNDGISDVAAFNQGASEIYAGNANTSGRYNNLQSALDFSEPVLARRGLVALKNNLTRLSDERAAIGAAQSRLESSAQLLNARVLEYKQAASKIADVDIAEESAKSVRLQIAQRIVSSVLAQANIQPRIALDLLKGALR